MVKNLRLLACKFELNQSQRKSTQSHRKSSQVGGQTKRKSNASPKRASTCESVWPVFTLDSRLYISSLDSEVESTSGKSALKSHGRWLKFKAHSGKAGIPFDPLSFPPISLSLLVNISGV